ncbi:hypothetical protein [Bdellovibrio sp. NC01]|uniref:hypothetical protein n=1 Tax=Bdellovibrio sp. NC01 TaxID=2220073 RepID=UPI00115B8026|nr:hypothetical protein [Bdellovibrio sp. NC01]QDK38930.1 hypothetical protein DOE51_15720 [Bdellovibrio sp. NC01]
MFTNKKAMIALMMGLTAVLAGCEQETEKDQIAEAQYCLDGATDASSANSCVAKIASIQTPQANALRCSAGFIGAGVTKTENLAKALTAIKDSNNGSSNVTTMLSFLNLGSNMESTFTACVNSNSKGMALVAAMAKSATTLVGLIPGFDIDSGQLPDMNDLKGALDDLVADASSGTPSASTVASLEAIGTAIETVYGSTCTNNSGSEICKSIDKGLESLNASLPPGDSIDLSSTDPKEIAQTLLEYWKSQN